MLSKITDKQVSLLKRKLYWTIGSLTDGERDVLSRLADNKEMELADAAIVIQDLFTITNPREDKYEQEVAVNEVRKILEKYMPPKNSVTCSRCHKNTTCWFEEDNGVILCRECREKILKQIELKKLNKTL